MVFEQVDELTKKSKALPKRHRKVKETGPDKFKYLPASNATQRRVLLSKDEVPCGNSSADSIKPTCSKKTPEGMLQYLVGNDKKCLQHGCNRELKPMTKYRFKAFVCTTAGCTLSLASKIIQTDRVKSDNSVYLFLVLGCFAILVFVILVPVFLFRKKIWMCFKRLGNTPESKPMEEKSNTVEMETSTLVVMNEANVEENPESIRLTEFIDRVERMHQDSNLLFSNEFELLSRVSPKGETTIAKLPANKSKNRYINILPYDHARVKLMVPDDEEEEGADYINASFIPGQRNACDYIAAQGPLKSTVNHFWRMIWEQRVTTMVMLTRCVEKGKIKCEEYWPPNNLSPMLCGDLQVQLRSESVLPNYIIRVIDLEQGNSERKTVHQFHFLKWPDFGCPENTSLLLHLVQDVRSHTKSNSQNPMLVHSSAGVGRSGTFIILDMLLQQITEKDKQEVNIFDMVLAIRKNRPIMVQSQVQYRYIYECLRDFLKVKAEKDSNLQAEDENIYMNQMNASQETSDIYMNQLALRQGT